MLADKQHKRHLTTSRDPRISEEEVMNTCVIGGEVGHVWAITKTGV